MKDDTPTASPEFDAFVERLDPDTRAFLDKLRDKRPVSEEEHLRLLCEQRQEFAAGAEAWRRRLRGYDEVGPKIDALTERLRRVEDLVSRFKMPDEDQ